MASTTPLPTPFIPLIANLTPSFVATNSSPASFISGGRIGICIEEHSPINFATFDKSYLSHVINAAIHS